MRAASPSPPGRPSIISQLPPAAVFNAPMTAAAGAARSIGRATLTLLAACLLMGLLAGPAVAAPADLDRGFGSGGVVSLEELSGGRFASDASARMAIGPE